MTRLDRPLVILFLPILSSGSFVRIFILPEFSLRSLPWGAIARFGVPPRQLSITCWTTQKSCEFFQSIACACASTRIFLPFAFKMRGVHFCVQKWHTLRLPTANTNENQMNEKIAKFVKRCKEFSFTHFTFSATFTLLKIVERSFLTNSCNLFLFLSKIHRNKSLSHLSPILPAL
jgi:hypothetical protein